MGLCDGLVKRAEARYDEDKEGKHGAAAPRGFGESECEAHKGLERMRCRTMGRSRDMMAKRRTTSPGKLVNVDIFIHVVYCGAKVARGICRVWTLRHVPTVRRQPRLELPHYLLMGGVAACHWCMHGRQWL